MLPLWSRRLMILAAVAVVAAARATAQLESDGAVEDAPSPTGAKVPAGDEAPADAEAPAGAAVPLNPRRSVLLDAERKRLLLRTTVVQREAPLEMLLCKTGTKEHETIVAIDAEAYLVHAGLLAIGAQPGSPVAYDPDYQPPTGQLIDIFVNWSDDSGRPRREPAQKWVRRTTRRYYVAPLAQLPEGFAMPQETELRHDKKRGELIWFGHMTEAERDRHLALSNDTAYQAAIRTFFKESEYQSMEADFVFAGSGFFVDDEGQRHYLAESGNVICVANFSDATIDIALRSTAQNDDLMFEPYTQRIPPVGTKVTLELVPRQSKDSTPVP